MNSEGLQKITDPLKLAFGGQMSGEEVEFLRGMQGFIEFGIRNGLSFRAVMAFMSHDWNEFARSGFAFEDVMRKGFSPRVEQFVGVTSESVGEAE